MKRTLRLAAIINHPGFPPANVRSGTPWNFGQSLVASQFIQARAPSTRWHTPQAVALCYAKYSGFSTAESLSNEGCSFFRLSAAPLHRYTVAVSYLLPVPVISNSTTNGFGLQITKRCWIWTTRTKFRPRSERVRERSDAIPRS